MKKEEIEQYLLYQNELNKIAHNIFRYLETDKPEIIEYSGSWQTFKNFYIKDNRFYICYYDEYKEEWDFYVPLETIYNNNWKLYINKL